jgi:SP family general alpha glucoside:H+ symporter-like MFS transporter
MVFDELLWEVRHATIIPFEHSLINFRRPIILVGVVLNFLLLVTIGIAGCFNSSTSLVFIGVAINLKNLFYAPNIGATSWAVSAEISTPKLRQKTRLFTCVNSIASWAFSFVTPYLINND